MKTWSFIGSDKNAGKTTALNFVHKRLHEQGAKPLCLTSIGINGEPIDNYENQPKPRFPFYRGEYFISAEEHLTDLRGHFETVHRYSPPTFSKTYLLGRSRNQFELVVEGPNEKQQLLLLKEGLKELLPKTQLLIDGSIDRQFIADPKISDGIYFSLLITDRVEQLRKAKDILTALQLPATDSGVTEQLTELIDSELRSLLLDEQQQPLYRGREIPFLDAGLKTACQQQQGRKCLLYLNGALSRSLFDYLSTFDSFHVVLDNFTLYQNISVHEGLKRRFAPLLSLLQPLIVKRIFVHRQTEVELELPDGVPVTDLFRDDVEGLVF